MTSPTPLSSPDFAPQSPTIRWPERALPAHAQVFASNELQMAAPPGIVWAWLLRAERWPTWYPNSADIHFISHTGPDLRDRTRFRWNTFGLRVTCKVLEFEPERRLAWEAHGIGLNAWHAWLLTPTPDGGTHVLTAVTQTGWIARLSKTLAPGRLNRMHSLWLTSLARQAATGLPAPH